MGHEQLRRYPLLSIFLVGTLLLVACGGAELMETTVEGTEASEEESAPEPEPTEEPGPTVTPPPSPPVTAVPPTPSLADRFRDIDRVLAETMQGALAYDAPAAMDLNDVEEVRLLLDLQQSPQQLEALLEAERDEEAAAARQMESAPINITDQMQAVLVSRDPDAMSVEPLRDTVQFISASEPTEWKWLLRPRREGRHTLYIVVSRLVRYDGDESWRLVEEYETDLDVTVTATGKLAHYAQSIVQFFLLPVLVGVVIGILVKIILDFVARRRISESNE